MGFKDDMQRELDAAQKEFGGDGVFVVNREWFINYFFDSKTQKSTGLWLANEGLNLAGAAGGMAAASTLFLGNLGVWGVLIGASTPIGWLAAGAGAGYLGIKYWNKGKDALDSAVYTKSSRYISCPLDQVARGLCQLTMPVAIAAAYSDGKYSSEERELIANHFVQVWGLNPKAVNEMIAQFEGMELDDWDSFELADAINKSIAELMMDTKDINKEELGNKVRSGVINLSIQVIESDNVLHRSEMRFIKRLASDLGLPDMVSKYHARPSSL